MSRLGVGLAWCLSFLTLVLPLPLEIDSVPLSRTALCALPWIACSGISAARIWPGSVVLSGGFFLPLLAAASGLDLASGQSASRVGPLALAVLGMSLVLAWTSSQASRSQRGGVHALLVGLYLGVPVAWSLLPGAGDSLASDGSWLSGSPLVWCWQVLLAPGGPADMGLSANLGLGISLLVFAGLCRLVCRAGEHA